MINLAFVQRSVDIVRNGGSASKWVYMSSDSLPNGHIPLRIIFLTRFGWGQDIVCQYAGCPAEQIMTTQTKQMDSDIFSTSLGKPAPKKKKNIQGSARPCKDRLISYRNGEKHGPRVRWVVTLSASSAACVLRGAYSLAPYYPIPWYGLVPG